MRPRQCSYTPSERCFRRERGAGLRACTLSFWQACGGGGVVLLPGSYFRSGGRDSYREIGFRMLRSDCRGRISSWPPANLGWLRRTSS